MIGISFTTATLAARKRIALVAHDHCKGFLLDWAELHKAQLSQHDLCATGTTGLLLGQRLGLPIESMISGPLGGDQQVGALIAEQRVDMLVFFCDNLIMQGHQNDVMGLVRLASLYNIPFATNRSTADFIISSPLYTSTQYRRMIPSCIDSYKNRKL